MMEVFAGLLSTRTHWPAAGPPARARRARQHPDHGPVRQRGQLRDLGGPKYFNHDPWAGPGPATPRSALERETYRALSDPFIVHWPAGSRPGRGPQPLRPRHRHGPHRPRCPGGRGPDPAPRGRPVAIEGVSFAHTFDNADTPSSYHDGWRAVCPLAGAVVRRGGHAVRHPDAGRDPHRAVSNHLACLRWCGFVTTSRDHRIVYYRLADDRVGAILELAQGLLDDNCDHVAACGRIPPA